MSVARGRHSRTSIILGQLCLGAMVLLFQNCGVSFQPAGTGDGSGLVLSSSQAFSVTSGSSGYLSGMVSVGKGAIFRVSVDAAKLSEGVQLFWDNVYSDGMSYCEQTTSIDQMTADFQCPSDGLVTLSLSIYDEESETTETKTLTIVVGLPSSVTIADDSDSGDSATPTPTPSDDPGETLYLNNCRDCHGDLASSTKLGTTRTKLDSAIASVAAMKVLSVLTSDERDLIVQALQ